MRCIFLEREGEIWLANKVTSSFGRATIFLEMVEERGYFSSRMQSPKEFEQSLSLSGEHWFFYWKHPVSSWKSKLQQLPGQTVSVPLNWAFHASENGEDVDFGEQRADTGLERLVDICESLRKELLFFLPLTPFPLFVNGGVPSGLAVTPVKSSCGMDQAFVDSDGKVNRFYSFYDPRVFRAFQNYVAKLADYFSQNGMIVSLLGCTGGGVLWQNSKGYYISYGEDHSSAFEQGFIRFGQKNDLNEIAFKEQDWRAKHFYHQMTRELYLRTAQDLLGDYWMGLVEFCFLGGGPRDLLKRSLEIDQEPTTYAEDLLFSLAHQKTPSLALIDESVKDVGFAKFFSQFCDSEFLIAREWIGELDLFYRPLRIFELYQCASSFYEGRNWHDVGLDSYLDKNYTGLYGLRESFREVEEEYKDSEKDSDFAEQLHILFGSEMDASELDRVLQFFLNGFSFVIDTFQLNEDLARRLECFILENSLQVEVIRYQKIEIKLLQLGEAHMLIFNGELLSCMEANTREFFWDKVLSVFEFPRQNLVLDNGIALIWKKRYPSRGELDFEHIRRAICYNPTGERKRVVIEPHKKFKLLKYQDEYRARGKRSDDSFYLVLEEGGYMVLDFGLIA